MEAPGRGPHRVFMRTGTTLLELLTAVVLLGVLSGLAVPALTRHRDRAVVLVARERVVGLIGAARRLGYERGSATLRFEAVDARAILFSGADTLQDVRLGPGLDGPAMRLGNDREELELNFDGLGLGRFASTTIRLRRGDEQAAVVVSSYGRVRRR
ncbi:MAG: hypothetical protein AMS19_03900 [Gemmatimonas sp. SG8_23]|jgi:hypothetical protein|nr:MAG: hypothetical protein AMS19_03900 [Gemmatimonas sp. SG8_23]